MGFGILFFGYIISSLFSLNNFMSVFLFVGYSLTFVALLKLSPYAKNFNIAKYLNILLIAVSLFLSGLLVIEKFITPEANFDNVKHIISPIFEVLVFMFNGFLLFGIKELAKTTDLPKLENRALRNFIVIAVGFAVTAVGFFETPIEGYLVYPKYLIMIVGWILNIILIFSCYMWICFEGDEDMERKPSRFAFINKLNDAFDRKEEEAIRSSVEYARSKKKKKKKKK